MSTTATFDTYLSEGIREDLTDVIYNIAPTDTPFVSNVGSGSSEGTYHEWQKDTLAAPEDSPVAEGADAAPAAVIPTVRLGNYCQIQEKSFVISGSDQKANNAGRGVEMAYQEAKKGLELRKDIEFACVNSNKGSSLGAGNAGGSPSARITGTVKAWIATNTDLGANEGADPTGDGTDGRTDETTLLRTFTEGLLTNVIDSIYLNGGTPDMIMAPTQQKRILSTSFRGSADENKMDASAKKIINAVDFYETDYGTLSVVPNRYMRQREVYVLDSDMWSVDYYRPFFTHDLAKTGDNEKKQMLVEWTLTSKEEASSGGIFDLTSV